MQFKLITVMTFSYQQELAIVRGRLESEGIESFTQDELTTQINPLFSNAIGGIKLQVKEKDVEKAVELLKEWGYIKEEVSSPNKLFTILNNFTSKIPLLKKARFELRLMILVGIIVGIGISTVYFLSLPTKYELLTNNLWSLDYVNYNGKNYIPESHDEFIISTSDKKEENLLFLEDGMVLLPGIKCKRVNALWQIEDNLLKIKSADTLDYVYNGTYKMDFSYNTLILKSQSTTLKCHLYISTQNFGL